MDSTEPDVVNALTKEGTDAWMKRIGANHLGSFARYMNPYSLLMTEAVYKNQRKENDGKRIIFSPAQPSPANSGPRPRPGPATLALIGTFTKNKFPPA